MARSAALAQESSRLTDSTIIGANFASPGDIAGRPELREADIAIETLVFFKNRELSGFDDSTAVEGDTDIGFLSPIRARYRSSDRTLVELGGIVGQNFGDDNALDLAEPLLRISYAPFEDISLIAGTILPTHAMHQALLDDSRIFDLPAEQGFQLRADADRWKHDTWINWRIRETDTRPEEFEVGTITRARFGGLHLDGQLLVRHVGGQLNTSDRVENNVAGLLGGSWGFTPCEGSPAELRGRAMLLHTTDDVTDDSATGVEIGTSLDTPFSPSIDGRLDLSHYTGEGLTARGGDPMYRFENYTQGGVNAILRDDEHLRIEMGVVLQHADGRLNYTVGFNVIWGGSFALGPARVASPRR